MVETPIKAEVAGLGKMKSAFFWPIYGELDEICFKFYPDRSVKNVEDALGLSPPDVAVLLIDGYAAYKQYAKKAGLTHPQCRAHTRRKFFDSQEYCQAVLWPKRCRMRTNAARALRPILMMWMYRLTQIILNAPRVRFPLIAKIGCFAGLALAPSKSVLQSLLTTCRLHEIGPYEYLVDVPQRVKIHPPLQLGELTPQCWKELFARSPKRSVLHLSDQMRKKKSSIAH
jgi:hypothetical protein